MELLLFSYPSFLFEIFFKEPVLVVKTNNPTTIFFKKKKLVFICEAAGAAGLQVS